MQIAMRLIAGSTPAILTKLNKMGRKITVEFGPIWTVQNCKENIKNGLMGIVEYHLHKDNSWIGYPFISMEDKDKAIQELKDEGYEYDSITYFEPRLFKLENPHLSSEQHLNNLLAFYQKHNLPK